jgi:hypothetical protein
LVERRSAREGVRPLGWRADARNSEQISAKRSPAAPVEPNHPVAGRLRGRPCFDSTNLISKKSIDRFELSLISDRHQIELVLRLSLVIRPAGETRIVRKEFKSQVFSSHDPDPVPACHHCGERPALVRSMLDSRSGCTVRICKCRCGEQWLEKA